MASSGDIGAQSKAAVETFFRSKAERDLDTLTSLFADDIVYTFPLPASGAQENWFVFDGKAATIDYQRKTLENFSQLHMRDLQITVSDGGDIVFVESRGDYVTADGRPYNNVYVFKFVMRDGKMIRVFEYANPVTYAVLAGLPIAGRDPPSGK